MNEKTLEKITGLSRRQIIMLQKTVIQRKNKIVVGLSYEYSDDEVEQFILAKVFKDCGYTYPEIKDEMNHFKENKEQVIDKAILKASSKIEELEDVIKRLEELKRN